MTDNQKRLSGKTIMVTGATAGIGEVTALELARMGANIVLVSRNPEKCRATAARIHKETRNPNVDYFVADLSSQAQIRQLTQQFRLKHDRLDVLVNNAGAVFTRRKLSVDGIEMTFALNHLSYFLLTNLLLDMLKASAPARVVNVSSNAHFDSALNFDDLQLVHGYSAFKAYGQSKFANLLFTFELARRLASSGVIVNALHPGLVKTDIGKNAGWWMGLAWIVVTLFRRGLTPEEGARTSIYLASSPEVDDVSGKYFAKQQIQPFDPAASDKAAARRLWEISAQLVGFKEG